MKAMIEVEPELEMLLTLEAARRRQPLEELVRDAVSSYFARTQPPHGAGETDRRAETADRFE